MGSRPYIIILGSITSGYGFIGPFDDLNTANEYAAILLKGSKDYTVAALDKPQE